jgi:hypothetical protein
VNKLILVPVEKLNYVDLKRPLKENEYPSIKKNSIKFEQQTKLRT